MIRITISKVRETELKRSVIMREMDELHSKIILSTGEKEKQSVAAYLKRVDVLRKSYSSKLSTSSILHMPKLKEAYDKLTSEDRRLADLVKLLEVRKNKNDVDNLLLKIKESMAKMASYFSQLNNYEAVLS